MKKVVCATLGNHWHWCAEEFPKYEWHFYNSIPKNRLEHTIRSPNLAMIRQAKQVAITCRDPAAVSYTHLTLPTNREV